MLYDTEIPIFVNEIKHLLKEHDKCNNNELKKIIKYEINLLVSVLNMNNSIHTLE
jgi:hypothetical protein